MKGILFRPEMIRAIVTGTKTVTRRIIKLQPDNDVVGFVKFGDEFLPEKMFGEQRFSVGDIATRIRPRYQVGETVYVKEAWCSTKEYDRLEPYAMPSNAPIFYMALLNLWKMNLNIDYGRVRSPLHLPAKFARTFLKIKDVRLERLQEITEDDAIKEGAPGIATSKPYPRQYRDSYETLWDLINPEHPFSSNPFVFRYELKSRFLKES